MTSEASIEERIIRDLKAWSQQPTVPFLHKPMRRALRERFRALGLHPWDGGSRPERPTWAEDPYALYVFLPGHSAQDSWLVLDTHLDHPGFVADGRGTVRALGSVGFQRVHRLVHQQPQRVALFHPHTGEHLGEGLLRPHAAFRLANPIYTLETERPIPPNTAVQWHLPEPRRTNSYIEAYAADNLLVTAVATALLEALLASSITLPRPVLFVFDVLEEIFEVSATHIAYRNQTPFGALNASTWIIVLENMQAEPLRLRDVLGERLLRDPQHARLAHDHDVYSAQADAALHPLYQEAGLPLPTYEDGLLLKVNGVDLPYGLHFGDQANDAEAWVRYWAEALEIPYQHTLSAGACNGTAYALYPTTPHLVTLVIPTRFKHNVGPQGEVVLERSLRRDARNLYQLLHHLTTQSFSFHGPPPSQGESMLNRLLRRRMSPDPRVLRALQRERIRIMRRAYHPLRYGVVFPETLAQRLALTWSRIHARLDELAERFGR
ncbi:MAG: hypothetical protein GXO54_06580 [Chloroflexi bacterium]|nr:hypothetical protein [Chloroflexota bacterium]